MKTNSLVKIVAFFFLTAGLAACNDTDEIPNDFGGLYRVVSMESDREIDMNNDGIPSKNIYREISAPHYSGDQETPLSVYDFTSTQNYAEIRPAFAGQNSTKYLLLNLPCPDIDYSGTDENKPLILYNHDMTGYFYEFTLDDQVRLKKSDPNASPKWSIDNNELKRIDEDNFTFIATTRLFDCQTKTWLDMRVKVVYQRVER